MSLLEKPAEFDEPQLLQAHDTLAGSVRVGLVVPELLRVVELCGAVAARKWRGLG